MLVKGDVLAPLQLCLPSIALTTQDLRDTSRCICHPVPLKTVLVYVHTHNANNISNIIKLLLTRLLI
jgi:hypothetical protein